MKSYTQILPNGDTATDCSTEGLPRITDRHGMKLAMQQAREAREQGKLGTRHAVLSNWVVYVAEEDGIWRHEYSKETKLRVSVRKLTKEQC